MGKLAIKEYASEYCIFLNLSATSKSTPGYLKMGFIPLLTKSLLTRSNLLGMTKFLLIRKKKSDFKKGKITFGTFNNIVVSDFPKPKEMAGVVSRQNNYNNRITLFQDEVFFKWRFQNKRNKYFFYYFKDNGIVKCYIVIRLSQNNRRGYICDYAADDDRYLETILNFIIKMKHLDILSIYNFSLTDNFSRILKNLRFRENSLIRVIEKRLNGEWPLLIRPVNKDFAESDLNIEGTDIRKAGNWEIKEICSDAA
jgi:hypothetical protein